MFAKLCWMLLTGMGLESGMAAGHSLLKSSDGITSEQGCQIEMENRAELQSLASQQYINNQVRHWRALVVSK